MSISIYGLPTLTKLYDPGTPIYHFRAADPQEQYNVRYIVTQHTIALLHQLFLATSGAIAIEALYRMPYSTVWSEHY